MAKLAPLPVKSIIGLFVWAHIPQSDDSDYLIKQPCKVLGITYDDHGCEESYNVETMFGQNDTVLTSEAKLVTPDTAPELFYRYMQHKTGYQQWCGFIGSYWGKSTGAVMVTRNTWKVQKEVRHIMETLWCEYYPLARSINLD